LAFARGIVLLEPDLQSWLRIIFVSLVLLVGMGTVISRAYDRQMPVLAHYSSEFTPIGFVLDLTGEAPKLRFDGSEEILVLRWAPAAGGDRLLLREDQFVLLRISGLGGITLFTAQNPRGVPVAPDRKQVQPLQFNAPSIAIVRDYAGRIIAQARAETGRTVMLDADWEQAARDPIVRGLLFDSIRNTGTALIEWIRNGAGRDALGVALKRIRFVAGPASLPYRQGDTFVVTFTPGQGLAGRPPSAVIYRQLAQFARR
jgi:hypothetical protein